MLFSGPEPSLAEAATIATQEMMEESFEQQRTTSSATESEGRKPQPSLRHLGLSSML